MHRLENAKLYANTSESQAASYDRDNPLYPYKSHGQWLKASYGLAACIILILFNGVGAFIDPFNVRKFVAAYLGVSSRLRRAAFCRLRHLQPLTLTLSVQTDPSAKLA